MNVHHRLVLEALDDYEPRSSADLRIAVLPKLSAWRSFWLGLAWYAVLSDLVSSGQVRRVPRTPDGGRFYYQITDAGIEALDGRCLPN